MRAEGGSQCIEPRPPYPPALFNHSCEHIGQCRTAPRTSTPTNSRTLINMRPLGITTEAFTLQISGFCSLSWQRNGSTAFWVQFNFLNMNYFWEKSQWNLFFLALFLHKCGKKTTCCHRCCDVSGYSQCYLVHLYMIMRQISLLKRTTTVLVFIWDSSLRETKLD